MYMYVCDVDAVTIYFIEAKDAQNDFTIDYRFIEHISTDIWNFPVFRIEAP